MSEEADSISTNRPGLFDIPLPKPNPPKFVVHPQLLPQPAYVPPPGPVPRPMTEEERLTAAVKLKYAEERLKTFTHWPKYLRPGKIALAKAGFVYTGRGDRVQCFSCKTVLCAWAPSDDPWAEHYKWFKDCEFLKLSYLPEHHEVKLSESKVFQEWRG